MGWGENASIMHTSLQGQQEIYIDIFKKELSNKVYTEWTLNLNWTDKKVQAKNSWLF